MSRRSRFAFLAPVLFAACGTPTGESSCAEVLAPLRPEGVAELRATLGALGREARFPGAVAVVWRAGQVALHEAYDGQDARTESRYSVDTIFPIASMTKPIVSVVVMQLVEEGRLALDEPIARYLPEFASPSVCEFAEDGSIVGTRPSSREITIADLLAHTSGLSYAEFEQGPLKQIYLDARLYQEFETNRVLSQAIAALPLAFEPGAQWRYGRSTDVLGSLIERLEEGRLESILRRRVLEPLGMDDTSFFVPPEKVGRLCSGPIVQTTLGSATSVDVRLPMILVHDREPAACSAGGGLYSTAADYLRFCEMLLGEGTRDGVRILSPESVRLMTTDRIAGLPRPAFLGQRGFGLGFAVLTEDSAGPLNGSVGSFHWSGIYGTSFFVDPEEQLIGVFLTHQYRDFSYMVAFRKAVYGALPGREPQPAPFGGNEVGE